MLFRQLILAATILCTYHSMAMAACLNTENKLTPEQLAPNRQECLNKARFLLNPPDVASEQFRSLLVNPASKKEGFVNGSIIHCRFVYQKQNGVSAKFRCARTNENNQLIDSKGKLVPEAVGLVSEGEEVYLTDKNNERFFEMGKDDKKKHRKALIMKVRYQDGGDRNVENYTSSAASRVFWALGIPAHSNYMTEKVVCFGCSQKPFKVQREPLMEGGKLVVAQFIDASIEIKFDGTRLYDPTQQPWKWSELLALHGQSTNEIRTEIEVLALASNLVGAIGKTDMQNAVVCTNFSENNKSECEDVVVMAHDLGAAFGSRIMKPLFGSDMPRGDLSAYDRTSVFQEGTCKFVTTDGGKEIPDTVSNNGKIEFLKRAGALTRENLKLIFAASHMGRLQNLKQRTKVSDLEDRWVQTVVDKLKEIQQAPCK